MGPRQDAGEDTADPPLEDLAFLLQWGPGRMPGKTCYWV